MLLGLAQINKAPFATYKIVEGISVRMIIATNLRCSVSIDLDV